MTERKCIFNDIINQIKEKITPFFGSPNKGIHSYRLFNIAYIDVIMNIIGAYIIQKLFYPNTKYLKILFYLFLIGILLHRIFGIRTTIDKLLFSK